VTFEDLAQLERCCGPALERHRPPLTVDLTAVDSVDRVTRLFLHHLEVRGVEIVRARQQP
jgi:hypothetical protein